MLNAMQTNFERFENMDYKNILIFINIYTCFIVISFKNVLRMWQKGQFYYDFHENALYFLALYVKIGVLNLNLIYLKYKLLESITYKDSFGGSCVLL